MHQVVKKKTIIYIRTHGQQNIKTELMYMF